MRLANRWIVLGVVAMVGLGGRGARGAGDGGLDLSSPKAAAHAFEAAMAKGDTEAAQRCVLDQPGQHEAAAALARVSVVCVRLDAASRKQFKTSLESDGNPHVTLRLPDPNGANYADVKGDDRFATVTIAGRKDDPTRVAKVGNEWRVDLTDEKRRTADDLRALAGQLDGMRKGMEELAANIEAGKVASVQDARWAFLGSLIKQAAGEVKVDVKPSSGGK